MGFNRGSLSSLSTSILKSVLPTLLMSLALQKARTLASRTQEYEYVPPYGIASGFPFEEKICPIELKYYCVTVAGYENDQEKIPVLLIHGLGESHNSWDGVIRVLARRTKRRVCSVDLRNHGDSPWIKRTDFKAMAADIGHFLDEQGIKKVNIVGHSLGGKVAVHYTLNNPDRVKSIVVEDWRPNGVLKEFHNSLIRFFRSLKEGLSKVPPGATEKQARAIIVNYLNKLGMRESTNLPLSNFLELKRVGNTWTYKYNIDVLRKALRDPDILFGYSTGVYKGPSLFIYGTESDVKVGEDKKNIFRFFPNTKLVSVEGAGHFIHEQFPEFNYEVLKFLNEANW